MTVEIGRSASSRALESGRPLLEGWRCVNLLPRQEVLLAIREGKVPIVNFKNSRRDCPLACGYCDTVDTTRESGSLSSSLDPEGIIGLVDLLQKEHGLRAIEFCGDGEPLTDWDLVTNFLDRGLKVSLFTNGILLTEERASFLTSHDAIVKVKLDALDPQIFGSILMAKKEGVSRERVTAVAERVISGTRKMVEARERLGGQLGKLVASIVVTNVNVPRGIPVEESPLGEVLRFCKENLIVPQVNYVEVAGGNTDNSYGVHGDQVREINRYTRELFGLDPKILFGENCFAMFAPIITGDGLMATGPFGLGCEFPLREHVGWLGEIRILSEPDDLRRGLAELNEFRKREEIKKAIIKELIKIQRREGVYGVSGSDDILPGCGAGVEENYLLVYVAGLWGSDEYLAERILPRLDTILTEKWSPEEVGGLIDQVR